LCFGGRRNKLPPALKILRQYSLVLLVQLRWREGKALGSEQGKVLGEKLSMSCVRPEYRPDGRTALELWALMKSEGERQQELSAV
jgi:hypothetical protein